MKRVSKSSKKGFTLVEMMLAIAITLLISGLFVALIVAVKDSFYRVYNDDDSTDYAALYSQALENQLLYDVQNNTSRTYKISSTDYILVTGATPEGDDLFGFRTMNNFNKNKDGVYKWRVYLTVRHEADGSLATTDKNGKSVAAGTVQYTFYMVDNYYNPGQLVQTYSGSFWIPDHGSFGNGDPIDLTVTNDGTLASFTSPSGTSYSIQPNMIVFKAS